MLTTAGHKNIFSWTTQVSDEWLMCVGVCDFRTNCRVVQQHECSVIDFGMCFNLEIYGESSGLQLLVVYLCNQLAEQCLRGALWLRSSSLGSQSNTLLTHFSRGFYRCLAVFQLDWVSSLFALLLLASCPKKPEDRASQGRRKSNLYVLKVTIWV